MAENQNNNDASFKEAEGEEYNEGEYGDMFIVEGEDGEFLEEMNEGDYPEGQDEEAIDHTTEEEKYSENQDASYQVDDMSSGVFKDHGDHIYAIAQHPLMPSIMLSGGGDDRVLVWDISKGDKDKNTLLEIKEGFKDSIEYIKFNHDNKYLLITGQGNPIRIYKVSEQEGLPVFEFKTEMETGEDISFVNWHQKANLFLTGGKDMMIWMFNALNGEFSTYTGHEDEVNNADFTPDGKLIVSISNDCTAKVWNPRTSKCIQTIKSEKSFHQCPIISMFLVGESMVTGDAEGYIYISQYKTGESVGPITKHSDCVEWIVGSNSKYVACGSIDGTIKIIDVGKQSLSIDIPKIDDQSGITRMKCSKTNPYIYVASTIGSVYWFDVRSGEMLRKLTAHVDSVMDFIVDEDQKKVVTVGDDQLAYVFDI